MVCSLGFPLKVKDISREISVPLNHYNNLNIFKTFLLVNIRLYVKVAVVETERNGVTVLKVDKIRPKMKLADGHINLIAADPSLQATGEDFQ